MFAHVHGPWRLGVRPNVWRWHDRDRSRDVGRRWITCDTSPVAVAIARQRLTTASFDYWTLADSAEGAAAEAELSGLPTCPEPGERWGHDPAGGFVYERAPTVSASSLAYDENPSPTLLVNQPRRTSVVILGSCPVLGR